MAASAQNGHEAKRLELLKQFAILDTPREETFDRIVRLACRLTGAPIGMVSLADTNGMWFKACIGQDAEQIPRELAFCSVALNQSSTLVIEDASLDPMFASSPFVTGPDHIRFYAGTQLRSADGTVLGTLCVLDRAPKRLDSETIAALEDLAHSVIAEMNLRRVSARLENELHEHRRLLGTLTETRERLQHFLAATSDLLWETDAELNFVYSGGGGIKGISFWEFQGRSLRDATAAFPLNSDAADLSGRFDRREPFYLVQFGRLDEAGSETWIESSGKPIFADGVFQGYRGVARDITERKAAEARIRRMADEDPLTGLANRRAFQRKLADAFDRRKTGAGATAVLLLDIDHFKQINDRHGHDVGDRMIQTVAQRIVSVIRDRDMLARIGGDEFAVILPAVDKAATEDVARRIVAAVGEPVATVDGEIAPSVSIGAVIVLDRATRMEHALKQADVALYQAKNAGRGRYALFDTRDCASGSRLAMEAPARYG